MAKRWLELLRENKRVAIVAACTIVFLVLLEDVLEGGLIKLDEAAYVLIVEHLRIDWLTPIMESISALATPVTLLVMLLLIVAFAPGRRPGACCALNLALVVVLNQVLKFLVQRPRPEGFRLAAETGFSFSLGPLDGRDGVLRPAHLDGLALRARSCGAHRVLGGACGAHCRCGREPHLFRCSLCVRRGGGLLREPRLACLLYAFGGAALFGRGTGEGGEGEGLGLTRGLLLPKIVVLFIENRQ